MTTETPGWTQHTVCFRSARGCVGPASENHWVNSTWWPLDEKNQTPVWTAVGHFGASARVRGFLAALKQPRPQANTTPTIVIVLSPLTPKSLTQSSRHTALWLSLSSDWKTSGDKKTKAKTKKSKAPFFFFFLLAVPRQAGSCQKTLYFQFALHNILLPVNVCRTKLFTWSTMEFPWLFEFCHEGEYGGATALADQLQCSWGGLTCMGEQRETITWLPQLNFPFGVISCGISGSSCVSEPNTPPEPCKQARNIWTRHHRCIPSPALPSSVPRAHNVVIRVNHCL